ncbi:sigma 54-interacting transcriptional regulator [Klebsiella pneumoniae]|uniref:sigma 54-interacting transcriptional regulator n=1 Tax=Klebsiella pneumoniae TaxID=573 RepID=UPI000CEBB933|nr:sigma 54-interacting transcriptional regulator [Klebsiella pneumoniae]ROG56639.1 AAA family ATPase [Klebsiella pneumoniae subsp. pneumoniae]ROG60006.1 AAA family ATPase [Klebsiella pneumoniae subsp. pneumoniae]HBR7547449.1 sigma 54-interacting transcriptional regulator [Klebsiella pneumoniae]HBS5390980.1 sigma 54-interacting transcriptional regulator [Klebsiella pneumoniae]HCB0062159.1 sigma 54-interacting transcriptional regulator [Klebsiella pneumoniae]
MSYTPMSDLGQQGLFDITRLLLQQPDLAALSETLTRLVQQSALADEAAIILWNAGNHRAARYACDEAGHPVSYEDETVLAHGPVRRLLSRPDALHCDHETFADTWPQLIRSGLYRPFGYYSLLPLAADGRIFGGCEFLRRDNRPWSEKEFQRLHTFAQIVAVVTEQIQNRVSNNVDYDLLCHERDNFRILVAITNAVLSRLDIDELVSEVAKEIHRYFRIDAISVVLRSDRKGKLNIYSTHYLDASHPVHDQSEVDEAGTLTEQLNNVESEFGEIIGRSEAMNNVLKQVEMVAQSDSTVLILGETGTGKELIARAIHNLSGRNGRRMVKMNCAAMPAGLLESDLFGHERGAFTGASAQRIGRFELADKSSLFLDEVGDMPLELQPKLLRVLQEQEFERLGSNKLIQTDVRLIAATNRDLKQMVIDREFRSDLYYRLNVFPIHLPPLRERPDDIPLLVKAFTFKIARRMGRNIDSIPAETLRTLTRMEWPGNVRELENVIERAVLLTRGNVLQLSLPERDIVEAPRTPAVLPEEGEDEYQLIVRVLKESNGVVAGPKGAAQRLGLKRTTLLSRMKRLGINKDELV